LDGFLPLPLSLPLSFSLSLSLSHFFFLFIVLRIEPNVLNMLDKCSTTELHPQPTSLSGQLLEEAARFQRKASNSVSLNRDSNHIDLIFFFLSFFLRYWSLNSGLHLKPLLQPFIMMGFFKDRILQNYLPGWLQTAILLISASWVAWITGVSHGAW
jgi:hypothetical protein